MRIRILFLVACLLAVSFISGKAKSQGIYTIPHNHSSLATGSSNLSPQTIDLSANGIDFLISEYDGASSGGSIDISFSTTQYYFGLIENGMLLVDGSDETTANPGNIGIEDGTNSLAIDSDSLFIDADGPYIDLRATGSFSPYLELTNETQVIRVEADATPVITVSDGLGADSTAMGPDYFNVVTSSANSTLNDDSLTFNDGSITTIYGLNDINLGNASDTTITRASAGVIAVEGSNVLTASSIGSTVQAFDADLTAIAGLTPTDSNFIVGNGPTWIAESGATARTSLGLGTIATQNSDNVSITGGSITGLTELTVDDLSLNNSTLQTPDHTATPATLNLIAGNNTSAGTGGIINLQSGNGAGTGRGGDLTLAGGIGTAGGGAGGSGRRGGDTTIVSGAGITSATTLNGGRAGNTFLLTANGGDNTAADSIGNGGTAGDLSITSGNGGDSNSTGTGAGGGAGEIIITAGDGGSATAGTGSGGNGGAIILNPGTGGTSVGASPGSDGSIHLNGHTVMTGALLPTFSLINTGNSTDEKTWSLFVTSSGSFSVNAISDNGGTTNNALVINRTGATVDDIDLNADVTITDQLNVEDLQLEQNILSSTSGELVLSTDAGAFARVTTSSGRLIIQDTIGAAGASTPVLLFSDEADTPMGLVGINQGGSADLEITSAVTGAHINLITSSGGEAQVDGERILTESAGSYSASTAGCSTEISGLTVNWQHVGNFVYIDVTAPSNTCTSDTTSFQIVGSAPAAIIPTSLTSPAPIAPLVDNGLTVFTTYALMDSSGNIRLRAGATDTTWAASGSKGFILSESPDEVLSFSYRVN